MSFNAVRSRVRGAISGQTSPVVASIVCTASIALPATDFSAWTSENDAETQAYARAEQANCLWYASRNHGFYSLQQQVLDGETTEVDFRIWRDFVMSLGLAECDGQVTDLDALLAMLTATRGSAQRILAATE